MPGKAPSPASGYNPALGDFFCLFSSWKFDPAPKINARKQQVFAWEDRLNSGV